LGRVCIFVFVLVAALSRGHAEARARDDVLAGAFRCGVVADSRTWLNCYYGAAQPMRGALGLAAVLPAQAQLASSPPTGGTPRDLGIRDAVMGEASHCYTRGDDHAWLNCYYAAVQPLRAVLGLPPAPQAAAGAGRATDDAALAEPPGGWLLGSRRGRNTQMAAYSFDPQGHFTVTLDDGQRWRQMPGDVRKAHWTRPARDYAVTISRGALGSTNLAVNGQPVLFKVEQLR
jgi:hypothetical protein